jgi:hypothetical protein
MINDRLSPYGSMKLNLSSTARAERVQKANEKDPENSTLDSGQLLDLNKESSKDKDFPVF